MLNRRNFLQSTLALSAPMLPGIGMAQSYPSRPVTLMVPLAPGGITDVMARALANHMSRQWGKSVIVDNKPGAAGQISANAVQQQPADGHTVYIAGTAMFAINQFLFRKFSYDTLRDFEPVTALISSPMVLAVAKDSPIRSVEELIALSKRNSSGITYASPGGVGTLGHLLAELFRLRTEGNMIHVPYKGSAPALQDLVANRVDFMFDAVTSTSALIKANKLRALAIASDKRSPLLPDAPTLTELGVPGVDVNVWFGAAVRSGTPATSIQALNQAFVNALNDPAIREQFAAQGMQIQPQTPAQFRQLIRHEMERWEPIIRSNQFFID